MQATIIPRGHALGMVSQLPDRDEYSTTRQQLLAQIDVCMGGKAAEELIFGEDFVTTGATSDLSSATRTARHMVEDCGMSARIGPLSLSDKLGAETRKVADAEVSDILKASYEVRGSRLGRGEASTQSMDGHAETWQRKAVRAITLAHTGVGYGCRIDMEDKFATPNAPLPALRSCSSHRRCPHCASPDLPLPCLALPPRSPHFLAVLPLPFPAFGPHLTPQPLTSVMQRVRALLAAHQTGLHALAASLLEQETLTQSQIKEVVGGRAAQAWVEKAPGPGGPKHLSVSAPATAPRAAQQTA